MKKCIKNFKGKECLPSCSWTKKGVDDECNSWTVWSDNDDGCALIVDLVESKEMGRGERLIYIEGMAQKTNGRFDPSDQPFSK